MSALRNAAFALALVVTGAQSAAAMPAASLATFAAFEDSLVSGQPVQMAQEAAVANYFDFDAIITLGALLLAGGGFGAYAAQRARQKQASEPAWRESVMRAVQADLAAFSDSYRRAA